MPFATATIIALSTAAAGIATSAYGYKKQADASQALADSTNKAEELRRQQAELTAQREQRKLFQDEMRARAQANSLLAAAGANFGSVVGGVFGNIEGSLGQNSLALAQNINIGEQLFTANEATSNAKADLSTANATVDVGRSLFSSSEKIGNIGATLFDPKAAK